MPSPLTHPLEALISQDGRPVARCVLRRGRYVIGQDRKNAIVVDAPSVSAQHAQLTVEGDDEFFIEDLGSANGTRVNGQPTSGSTPITLGCHVEIGSTTLEFQRGGLPASVFAQLGAGFMGAQRYDVREVVVQGRTSSIHEARDLSLNRSLAMKIMLPESQAKPAHVLRFIREAKITAQLQHPGILPIYDLGLDDQRQLFSTTRFVEGDSLAGILDALAAGGATDTPPPTLAALIAVFQKMCDAVAYAHSRGVVHCTLRPEVITVGRFGEVFVNNWGLAKIFTRAGESAPRVTAPEAGTEPALSRYSAPEQAEGALDDIDPAPTSTRSAASFFASSRSAIPSPPRPNPSCSTRRSARAPRPPPSRPARTGPAENSPKTSSPRPCRRSASPATTAPPTSANSSRKSPRGRKPPPAAPNPAGCGKG